MKRLPLLGLLCGLAGCDPFGPVCTDIAIPAIGVIVSDSVTNDPVLAGDIMVVATAGAFSDTVRGTIAPGNYNRPWFLAHEQAGNYTVEVFVTDYHPWSINNVIVQEDECHVITRTLTARVRPLE